MSRVAVTGATGYLGGRLVPLLLEQGHEVTVLTRRPESLRDVPWRQQVGVIQGDLADPAAAAELCRDAEVFFYLVHSMAATSDFAAMERRCAQVVARAAAEAGVRQIVYLSGLHPDGELSHHLSSRVNVGRILDAGPVPVLVLQAGLVIGSGSASFEMVRHLADVLPVMPAPRWVLNKVQPIAVRDTLYYLAQAAQLPEPVNDCLDIGGERAYTYAQLMQLYAEAAGIRRPRILALPVLTPWLAAQWVNLVTPIPRSLAIPLVGSLQHHCVMRDRRIDELIPPPAGGLTDYPRALELALEKIRSDAVQTSWATAHPVRDPGEPLPSDPQWAGRRVYLDRRERLTSAGPAELFTVISSLGGDTGYYSLPIAWRIRGVLDKLAGGVGLNRGRRNRTRLELGDVVDWWRVEALDPQRMLRLRAEMRVPGRAWLEFTFRPEGDRYRYMQRAIFFPRSLAGRLYWYALVPFHGIIFSSMARSITAAAEKLAADRRSRGAAANGQ
ncbi:SDR family oxidoreductase [Glutamicibacter sp. MNS18]|uniref:SDR family oxidoreductase n=1 Tax=Glutamicibacter sp. MNS18 TaxID=2989817 RepID=UPI002236AA4F|nr:SDR family oxidoreductase [Glutamicibacter sp. MNS18]MCW4466109.1 SDR family oxidoreductase [Glutamicibacter sp. MNS18]